MRFHGAVLHLVFKEAYFDNLQRWLCFVSCRGKQRLIKINKREGINEKTSGVIQTGLSRWRSSIRERETVKLNGDDVHAAIFFFSLYLHCDAGRALTWLCGVIYDCAFAMIRNAMICAATRFSRIASHDNKITGVVKLESWNPSVFIYLSKLRDSENGIYFGNCIYDAILSELLWNWKSEKSGKCQGNWKWSEKSRKS